MAQRNIKNLNDANDSASVDHQIVIQGGCKKYEVYLLELSAFFDAIYELNIDNLDDLNVELEVLADFALDGAPEDLPVSAVKNKLKLMRSLIFLFQGFVSEVKS